MIQAERYFKQVSQRIPIEGKRKKEFLIGIRESVMEYAAQAPNATISQYHERFGTPEDIAVSFLSEMPYVEIDRKIRRGRAALVTVCCVAAFTIVSLAVTILHMRMENRKAVNGYVIEEEAEVTESKTD